MKYFISTKQFKVAVAKCSELRNFVRNEVFNRQIDFSHVNDFFKLIKEKVVESGEFAMGPAIFVVNEVTNVLMDGQHKKEAILRAIEEGILPEDAVVLVVFEHIEDGEKERQRIIELNTKTKTWSLDDYLKSYASNPNYPQYQRLEEFCKSHPLCQTIKGGVKKKYNIRYAAAIVLGKTCPAILKAGAFSATEEEWERAEQIHDEIKAIRDFFEMPSDTSIEQMVKPWLEWRDIFNVSDLNTLKLTDTKMKSLAMLPKKNQNDWDNVYSQLYGLISKANKAA